MNGGYWRFFVGPRYVKENKNGIRPFQQQLLEAVSQRSENIIIVEAPVGSGKTFAVRQLLVEKQFERRPVVLIYPTKILMEAQVGSFKRDLGERNVRIWPWENFAEGKINIFVYSTDTLVEIIRNKKIQSLENRSELLYKLFLHLGWFSKYGGIVTSPDVLYLLIQEKYKDSYEILNFLQNSVFVFDEFHCYYGLQTFLELLDYLLSKKISSKIILLSATPLKDAEFKKLEDKYKVYTISFDDSIGGPGDICFNYELEMEIFSFKLSVLDKTEEKLMELLPTIPKPAAIIFDSIFRLRHIAKRLKKYKSIQNIDFKEWSGMIKEKNFELSDKTVVLATSAIEVGVDMKFKSLIFESSYWPSAIQRLGRVARKEKGIAIMFTRKDFSPYLSSVTYLERTEFEERVLKKVLNDPKEEISDGFSFRGQSFNFILVDEDLNDTFVYNENLFAMYEINEFMINDWRLLNLQEKYENLKKFGISLDKIEYLLLYDKIIPFWGVLKGRLNDEYKYLSKDDVKYIHTQDRNELSIRHYIFYGS